MLKLSNSIICILFILNIFGINLSANNKNFIKSTVANKQHLKDFDFDFI
jgi:hypothetical protein